MEAKVLFVQEQSICCAHQRNSFAKELWLQVAGEFQRGRAGLYALREGFFANGCPVFQRKGGATQFFLYTGSTGQWFIAPPDEKIGIDKDFDISRGAIRSKVPHGGQLPQDSGHWEVWNGSAFVDGDLVLRATAFPFPEELVVEVPATYQKSVAGAYKLSPRSWANGWPTWTRLGPGAQAVLYSSENGKWFFADDAGNFDKNKGFIASTAPHGGTPPEEIRGWQIADGQGGWIAGDGVTVRASPIALVQAPKPAPQYCNDKHKAIKAVKRNGLAIEYVSETLRNDLDVAIEAVKQNGEALQYCSMELRNNKEVVMEAARTSPSALMFASKRLAQDMDCLKIACLKRESKAATMKGIFSVKFGFTETASRLSTVVAGALARHPALCTFQFYNPNCFEKKSCNNDSCLGTKDTCTLEQQQNTTDSRGTPTNNSCWRFSYRFHQQVCKESEGFMLQLEENDQLGEGQKTESLMAEAIGLKVFQFRWHGFSEACLANSYYVSAISNQIADAILDWIGDETRDTERQIIEADIFYESQRFAENWFAH